MVYGLVNSFMISRLGTYGVVWVPNGPPVLVLARKRLAYGTCTGPARLSLGLLQAQNRTKAGLKVVYARTYLNFQARAIRTALARVQLSLKTRTGPHNIPGFSGLCPEASCDRGLQYQRCSQLKEEYRYSEHATFWFLSTRIGRYVTNWQQITIIIDRTK